MGRAGLVVVAAFAVALLLLASRGAGPPAPPAREPAPPVAAPAPPTAPPSEAAPAVPAGEALAPAEARSPTSGIGALLRDRSPEELELFVRIRRATGEAPPRGVSAVTAAWRDGARGEELVAIARRELHGSPRALLEAVAWARRQSPPAPVERPAGAPVGGALRRVR